MQPEFRGYSFGSSARQLSDVIHDVGDNLLTDFFLKTYFYFLIFFLALMARVPRSHPSRSTGRSQPME